MGYPESFLAHRVRDEARVTRWTQRILRLAPEGAGGLAIDIGCGVGRFTAALLERFPCVIGLDRDPRMLALAAQRSQAAALNWLSADATALPLMNGCARFLLGSMVLEHVPDKAGFFREAARVLMPGGALALRTMLPEDIDATSWYLASAPAMAIERARTPSWAALSALAAQAGLVCRSAEHIRETVGQDAQLAPLSQRLRERSYEALQQLGEADWHCAVREGERLEALAGWRETLASSLLLLVHRN